MKMKMGNKKQNIQDKIKLVREMKRPMVVVNADDAKTLIQIMTEAKEGLVIVFSKNYLLEQGQILVYDYNKVQELIRRKEIHDF